MPIDVASLERRSPEALRAFARAQRVGVERRPDAVEPATPSDRDYWRFLVRRVPLEGICAHYQTYDASGDENDWNLNIHPDAAYRWMLDPQILWALSVSSGAPRPIDLGELKHYDGIPAIECELTPDDGLYDKFASGGLPITSGGWWPDGAEQEGRGPTSRRVGVYGVFAGDYGHGGRPEIHPFDAFWRRFHEPRSPSISWDLGVFQDDSNRFNGDWSKAPIDVEFRVPFCLDVPVTRRGPVTATARFVLRRSGLCSVVGKNARARTGVDVSETFSAPTVLLGPRLRNRLVVSVEDRTGLPGRPFGLALGDLAYTRVRGLGVLGRAWLSGAVVVRVAVDQDGFAYWNLSGPNSATAADARSPRVGRAPGRAGGPLAPVAAPTAAGPAAPLEPIRVVEARAAGSTDGEPRLAADVVIEHSPAAGAPVRRALTVRPRRQPIVEIGEGDRRRSVELESFDLFATASEVPAERAAVRTRADISAVIARLAGLTRIGRALPPAPATIEVQDVVTIDVRARYAPFRNGAVQGEERSLLSETLTSAMTAPPDVLCDVRIVDAEGRTTRLAATRDRAAPAAPGLPVASITTDATGHRLVVGPLGRAPASAEVEASLVDRFGLRAHASARVDNYRIVEPLPWLEQVAGISLDELRRRHERAETAGRRAPTPDAVAAAGMTGCLLGIMESLGGSEPAPASRVAGAIRLADRVAELMPR